MRAQTDNQMIFYKKIPQNQQRRARKLLKENIPAVIAPDFVNNDNELIIRNKISIYRLHGYIPPKIYDLYIGAYKGNILIGVLHTTSFLYQFQFSPQMSKLDFYSPEEINDSLTRYANIAASGLFIEELAVVEEYRNQGIATQLLNYLQDEVMKNESINHLVTASTDPQSHQFFSNQGFTDYGDALPAHFFGGIELKMQNRYTSYASYLAKEN